ncbi:hypothetical protein [Actinomadura parmotrematis]|uniref:Uncharacterized protein n=1 Tax=Actinomadura parmotrematis TaxID=2864039 RepID=A0ABS7G1E6_9ACTN|nr:hypothetical protein [Actinomadura parmotrematis]MBW8485709.1 hypothetical protein [Actinomadura parmotrematis]
MAERDQAVTADGRTGEKDGRPRRAPSGAAARASAVRVLAGAVSAITTVVVAILAVHIVFTVFEANTGNGIVSWFADWADRLAWQFKDVFEPADAKLRVAVNYGLAAVAYLVAGRLLVALIRRIR